MAGVAEVGFETEGTLVVEDSEAVFVEAVVRVAEVVVEVGRLVAGVEDCVVTVNGFGEVALGVGVVGAEHKLLRSLGRDTDCGEYEDCGEYFLHGAVCVKS